MVERDSYNFSSDLPSPDTHTLVHVNKCKSNKKPPASPINMSVATPLTARQSRKQRLGWADITPRNTEVF